MKKIAQLSSAPALPNTHAYIDDCHLRIHADLVTPGLYVALQCAILMSTIVRQSVCTAQDKATGLTCTSTCRGCSFRCHLWASTAAGWCPVRDLYVRHTFRMRYRNPPRDRLPKASCYTANQGWKHSMRSHPLPSRKHAFRPYVTIRYCIRLHEARSYVLIGLVVGN